MPRKAAAPKPPKRPSWSIWRHKKEGWLTFYLEGHLRPEYDWQTKTHKPPKYSINEFEQLNPAEFTLKATLQFEKLRKHQSALNFEFRCLETGAHYVMLTRGFEHVLKTSYFHKGAIKGLWKFEKYGGSVGIYLVKELDDDDEDGTQNDNSSNPG